MLVISQEQMAVFSRVALDAFEERMQEMVELRYPRKARDLTEPELRAIVHSGVQRARRYGIDLTRDVEQFIRIMFRFRVFEFEKDPPTAWTRDIFTDDTLTADEKLGQVEGRASLFGLIERDED